MNVLKKIYNFINLIEEKFLAISFMIVIIIIFTQVVLRFLGMTNTWSEELARYLFIWESWVGISFCERYNEHIKITFLVERLPKLPQTIADIISNLICGAFAAVLAYLGFEFVSHIFEIGTVSPSIHAPMWLIYLALPVGCVLYLMRIVLNIIVVFTGKEVHEEWK